MSNKHYLVDRNSIYEFLLAGKCKCAIKNENTGKHFAYVINEAKKKNKDGRIYFVSVAYDYVQFRYAGTIFAGNDGRLVYKKGEKGSLESDAQSIRVIMYVIERAKRGALPEEVNVYHFGKCAKCGRTLQDPVSISIGLGPICRKI